MSYTQWVANQSPEKEASDKCFWQAKNTTRIYAIYLAESAKSELNMLLEL